MLYAVYIMELLDKSLMDREPLPRLYTTTLEVLELFNEFSYRPLIMRYFEMSLLKNLGYLPILDHCVLCGKNDEALQNFSLSEGGMLCRKCSAQSGPHISLTGEALALIRLLNTAKSKTLSRVKASDYALEKVEYFLEKFLEFHLERKFNMKNTIRTLKRKIPC
jgi:DNA repair protein RecO (recombination protein O)